MLKNTRMKTEKIAHDLLGMLLIHDSPEGKTVGRIVETEAYLATDPACHASRGCTPRNQVMFGPPWHAYVYFIYGMYHCFNVVTAPKGIGEAVLIRALEPLEGLGLMEKRRLKKKPRHHKISPHQLCNGPAKLVLSMGILPTMNGISLKKKPLQIIENGRQNFEIVTTTRIGIEKGKELPLRFYIEGNPCVSKK